MDSGAGGKRREKIEVNKPVYIASHTYQFC